MKAEARLPTVGFLDVTTASNEVKRTAAFEQRLRELGWIEGPTVAIEHRWAKGATTAMPTSRPISSGLKTHQFFLPKDAIPARNP